MLFGEPSRFAIEAFVEPGPEYGTTVGANVAGRVCLHLAGHTLGNIDEPLCVLAPVCRHLTTLCASSAALWHPSLAGLSGPQQFALLDAALFSGTSSEVPEEMSRCIFLTNVCESFDSVKGFALVEPGAPGYRLLVAQAKSAEVSLFQVPVTTLCSAAGQFALWLQQQEHELFQTRA